MKLHKTVSLTREKWLNLYRAEYSHNGHRGQWVYASRKKQTSKGAAGPEAVIIVPVLKEKGLANRLVVIKEFRVPVGGYTYGFPAGLVDEGESVESAVRREMIEETGLHISRIRKVTSPLHSSMGLTDEAVALVYADVKKVKGSVAANEATEDIEVVLLDFAGVCALCDNPGLPIDAKLWATLHMFQRLGKIS